MDARIHIFIFKIYIYFFICTSYLFESIYKYLLIFYVFVMVFEYVVLLQSNTIQVGICILNNFKNKCSYPLFESLKYFFFSRLDITSGRPNGLKLMQFNFKRWVGISGKYGSMWVLIMFSMFIILWVYDAFIRWCYDIDTYEFYH